MYSNTAHYKKQYLVIILATQKQNIHYYEIIFYSKYISQFQRKAHKLYPE